HDQTKINILQLFQAVINRTNVDYAALLWWDFMNNVRQTKEVIKCPRFIKLILAVLMKKFLEIPQRIKEGYHSIKDDIPLVSVYTLGDVHVRGMLIPDEFLTEETHATDDFKVYETVFVNVDVPTNQLQLVVSTQGTHRSTPRAHRIPILTTSPQGNKRKQSVGESSSPRKTHKITIKKMKQNTPSIPLRDDRERDAIVEATFLSLSLHKIALAAEAQENVAKLGDGGTPVVDHTLYRSLAGSLQYLIFTRPDITYVVQQVCLYMHDPREPHFSALKQILRHVQGTLDYGLQLFSSTTDSLIAYSDADWAGCPTTRRSTSGYCVFLGNNLLSWPSKRQPTLSRSSAEAEYRGVASVVAETCWIRNLLRELHTHLSSATIVYCDNKEMYEI
nr:ribonuclease H-like domain-containing protein [Tanacetum cinerariifolium]